MRRTYIYPFLIVSGAGFLTTAAALVAAFAEYTLLSGFKMFALYVGPFFVWTPVMIAQKSLLRATKPGAAWSLLVRGCPAWMRYGVYALCAFVIFNFLFFSASPSPSDVSAGSNNDPGAPAAVRSSAALWLLFYGTAFAILYSALHVADSESMIPAQRKDARVATRKG
jgi:hypothetical protein